MAENTKIEWADHTFNPWMGCTKVSLACDHCYAEVSTPSRTMRVSWGAGQPRIRTSPGNWKLPERWNAKAERLGVRYRVFCASLADVFDNEVPVQWRRDLFDLIAATPNIDWLLLTKRIGNARNIHGEAYLDSARAWPPNVWIGATICNQEEADRDIPKLLRVPAAKRFLSIEPLLGSINLRSLPYGEGEADCLKPALWADEIENWRGTSDTWEEDFEDWYEVTVAEAVGQMHPGVDWVIVGGESGPQARPMHPDWAWDLKNQCEAAGVPYMFKQWGEWMPESAMSHEQRMKDQGQVECLYLKLDGSTHWVDEDDHTPYDASDVRVVKVGKKAAGRLLDGRTYDGVPA